MGFLSPEYLGIFHLLLQPLSTGTLQHPPPRAVPGPVWTAAGSLPSGSFGFSQWSAQVGKSEGRRRVKLGHLFSQLLLCDWVSLLRVTAPISDPLHTGFSVWVQKMLPRLAQTSLALTSLFLQPLVASLYPGHTLVDNPLITLPQIPRFNASAWIYSSLAGTLTNTTFDSKYRIHGLEYFQIICKQSCLLLPVLSCWKSAQWLLWRPTWDFGVGMKITLRWRH